jgi:hypothetical protein
LSCDVAGVVIRFGRLLKPSGNAQKADIVAYCRAINSGSGDVKCQAVMPGGGVFRDSLAPFFNRQRAIRLRILFVMKLLFTFLICGIATICIGTAQTVRETTTTATPVQSMGTVTTFDPTGHAIVVTGADNAAPVTYGYTEKTVMTDELGNPVTVDVVKSGVPVTVFYTQSGSQIIASKVVVRKAIAPVIEEKRTTTTTTTTE